MAYLKKPGIPPAPAMGDKRDRFDGAVKECLETVMGRSTTRIKPLDSTATLADCINKINEILYMIQ